MLTAFFLSVIFKFTGTCGRCSKMICRIFLSYHICIVLLFDLLRRLLTVNCNKM